MMSGVGGHEEFTLTGKNAGSSCVFRIAYARQWEFTNFEDVREANSDNLIEIPVKVLEKEDSGALSLIASAMAVVALLTI